MPKKPAPQKKLTEEVSDDESLVGGGPAELQANHAPETSAVLAAIHEMSNKMNDRFNSLETSLLATQATLLEHANRITAVENMSSDHDDRLLKLEQLTTKLEDANKVLQEKVIDLEARSRRQNIKIVGLPENVESGRLIDFVSNLFPTLFGKEHFPRPIKVDHAHRLGSRQANTANRPRVLIARIHDVRIKELIMQQARQQAPLKYQGQRIHIFPDFPTDIMKRRQLFEAARKRLNDAGIRTGFIYPARLIVTHGNVTSRFDTPEEAMRFADGVETNAESSRE